MTIFRGRWRPGLPKMTSLTEPASRSRAAGTLPSPFEPIVLLGSGGEGEVWLASDPLLGRKVVCKRLHDMSTLPPGDDSGEALKSLACITGTAVPSLYGVVDHAGARWLILEYVEGLSLDRVAGEMDFELGPVHLLVTVIDLCDALDGFHLAGFVHGDVSPGNAVITRDGRARFVDFGLTRNLGEPMTSRGVDGFCAPETVENCIASPAIDAYALGALLFWLMCRRTPTQLYDAAGKAVVLHPDAPEMPAPIEAVLWALARQLTDADPLNRPGLSEVMESLRAHERGLPVGSRDNLARMIRRRQRDRTAEVGVEPGESASASAPRFPRKLLFGAVVGLLLLLVIPVSVWRQGSSVAATPTFSVAVESMSVSPGTPLPQSFDESWLETQMALDLNRFSQGSESGEHRVILGLSCVHELCQLVAEHHPPGRQHWHQRTVIASASSGLWRGVIRDLAQAVAGF